jgi:hypothetical protein
VILVLRFVGLVNAAIWLGAAVFFTVAVGPAFFSEAMLKLFGGPQAQYSHAYAGMAAMVVIKRYFLCHHVCGAIAILHGMAEAGYQGLPFKRFRNLLAVSIFTVGLALGLLLQPRMGVWLEAKYNPRLTSEARVAAAHSFSVWHGVSQVANLLMTGGLLVFFLKTAGAAGRDPKSNPFQFKS